MFPGRVAGSRGGINLAPGPPLACSTGIRASPVGPGVGGGYHGCVVPDDLDPDPSPRWRAGNAEPVSVAEVRFWRSRVRRLLQRVPTPCFLFAAEPLERQVQSLEAAFQGLPVVHWWSFKTLPVQAPVAWWLRQGRPVEVVSEFEWRAVRALGVPVERILVNGPAKHRWLPACAQPGMRVHFDSIGEIRALSHLARNLQWRIGVRLGTSLEVQGEIPGVRAQFGLDPAEVPLAARLLRKAGLRIESLHLHLRTNVPEAGWYARAADEVFGVARKVGWEPWILDLGGGFPVARVATRKGAPFNAGFSMGAMRNVLLQLMRRHGVSQLWLENGRWLTAPAGVLALRVLDEKQGRGLRTLLCDGGRTLQALVATWERHAVVPLDPRRAPGMPTLLCGPTCMAFDNLGVHPLSGSIRPGDVLLWLDAGAYQVSWETSFSHGLAAMGWAEGHRVEVVREAESCDSWISRR